MQDNKSLSVFIGFDSREAIATEVCEHSIRKRTEQLLDIHHLRHRDLRKRGLFNRPWLVGEQMVDILDNKPFSTEFSHTRFLVPVLMEYKGWALFCDSDMIFLSDIKKLFALCDDRFAVMCVKHNHKPDGIKTKMDGRQQLSYHRKNWSSFVLFNCGHNSNKVLTEERVNFMTGADLHSFSWLADYEIGGLPYSYNFIPGVSPKLPPERGGMPDVIHYTAGGPWFKECEDVPYAGTWMEEYECFQQNGGTITDVRTVRYDAKEDNTR